MQIQITYLKRQAKFVCLFVCLLSAFTATAQKESSCTCEGKTEKQKGDAGVNGIVTYGGSENAIKGMSVCIMRDGRVFQKVKSTSGGKYRFKSLPPGEYEIIVCGKGSVNGTSIPGVILRSGKTEFINIFLSPPPGYVLREEKKK